MHRLVSVIEIDSYAETLNVNGMSDSGKNNECNRQTSV